MTARGNVNLGKQFFHIPKILFIFIYTKIKYEAKESETERWKKKNSVVNKDLECVKNVWSSIQIMWNREEEHLKILCQKT